MKNPKKPTLAQKKILSLHGLKWFNWLVVEETADILKVQNKISNKIREIKKK